MFRNMASSLIKTVRVAEGVEGQPKVSGRIITTVAKAKELRPYVERLVTMARKALVADAEAVNFATTAERNSAEWKQWRSSPQWRQWAQARSTGVTLRRRAFALLRDTVALEILFSDVARQFADRNGGYTRILKVTDRRLGDSGPQALIEFVGRNDRVRRDQRKRKAPIATTPAAETPAASPESPA